MYLYFMPQFSTYKYIAYIMHGNNHIRTYIYLFLSDVNEEVTPDRDADSTEEDPNEELCEGMHS